MSKKKAPTKPVRSVSDHVVCSDIMQTFEYEGNFLPVRTFMDKISDISDLRHPPQEGVEYGIRVDYPGHDGGYELQLVRRVTESDQALILDLLDMRKKLINLHLKIVTEDIRCSLSFKKNLVKELLVPPKRSLFASRLSFLVAGAIARCRLYGSYF